MDNKAKIALMIFYIALAFLIVAWFFYGLLAGTAVSAGENQSPYPGGKTFPVSKNNLYQQTYGK